MDPRIEAEILAASQTLRLPGSGERRVLSPVAVERLADTAGWPRWKVEARALQSDASAALIGRGAVLERALELLAQAGIGRLLVRVPTARPADAGAAEEAAGRLALAARNGNASCEVETGGISFKGGNPAEAIRGSDIVAACLEDAADEQLLQFACRMARAPLVLAGAEDKRGQATTVFPGDAGVALVYKPTHPHLPPLRTGAAVENKASLMVAAWMAEQATRVLLDDGELLRGWLLYADLSTGEMTEYPL
jgi:molybdopterin/thiamine biosynthesis adenylyltransferase